MDAALAHRARSACCTVLIFFLCWSLLPTRTVLLAVVFFGDYPQPTPLIPSWYMKMRRANRVNAPCVAAFFARCVHTRIPPGQRSGRTVQSAIEAQSAKACRLDSVCADERESSHKSTWRWVLNLFVFSPASARLHSRLRLREDHRAPRKRTGCQVT